MSNTARFVKQNPEIFVSTSDKGSKTVVSYKEQYNEKLTQLLDDTTQFQPLKSDPTGVNERKNNRLVMALFKQGHINEHTRKMLTTRTSNPARLFGQIKAHKEGHPVRPIVSTINSPSYKLARYLATILKISYKDSPYNVPHAREVLKRVKKVKIPDDQVLVLFDVVNCFGNIPAKMAIELVERDFEKVALHTKIPKKIFINLLSFCMLECNHFVFEGKHYQLLLGMFMGSSLAPILVERAIEEAISSSLKTVGLTPIFWLNYVDDHLSPIPRALVNRLHEELNAFDPHIKFTIEVETNNCINFLDVTLVREGARISYKSYSKPIASNRLINYFSAHPAHMKNNTTKAFLEKCMH